ncbi:MAG: histidine phosphatase family protein [Acidimicrobiales bacterium]
MTHIYLVRHGRTALNAVGVLRGHLDPALDAVGLSQASVLGDLLGKPELRLVVSSPLQRAVETARAVACRAGHEVETDRRLIDRDYGSWAGKPRELLVARFGSVNDAPGVEPEGVVLARAMDALDDARRRAAGGDAVVVSHDAVNSVLLTTIDERLGDSATLALDTGCFSVLEYRDRSWSVLSVNNAPPGRNSPDRLGGTGDVSSPHVTHSHPEDLRPG